MPRRSRKLGGRGISRHYADEIRGRKMMPDDDAYADDFDINIFDRWT